ncbi:MAG TPA: zinc ribbon domain-containing protein [Gaiellaceae bacterium]|nr:zinc ribbon domain-containing protein [Gaiellaceae bacterium]
MPTYEYRCTKGHSFEVTQRINDPPLTKCQVCGRPVERVMHSPAVHFKGSGFYNTDYGTKKRQREQKSSSESGSSESSTSSSTESTPAKSGGAAGNDSKATEKAKPKRSSE